MPHRTLGQLTLVVRDYHEAIRYYTNVLGFVLIEDTPRSPGKRWVVVAPSAEAETRILLAKAASPEQTSRIGTQAGGRVFLFLQTDDFDRDFAAYTAAGVKFLEPPRAEAYGKVAVFEDLYGNRWDLLESART